MSDSKEHAAGWEKVADWYDKLSGEEGHYYHREIIIPQVMSILKNFRAAKVLDLACGQGVLERALPADTIYCGVDISPSLTKQALQRRKSKNHQFLAADVASKNFSLPDKDYDVITLILALQDIKDAEAVFYNASKHLREGGRLVVVMNHPCFRIPRQSAWHVDEINKMQSRQIKGYMSSFEIPISVNPGKGKKSEQVVYHHHSLSTYSHLLSKSGFYIESIEEWISNKQSTGSKAKMENRARKEFPLFLCLICRNHGFKYLRPHARTKP